MCVLEEKRETRGTGIFFFFFGASRVTDDAAKDSASLLFLSSPLLFVDAALKKAALNSSSPTLMSPLHQNHHHEGGSGDIQAQVPNAYEQEREARIAANRARLVELGIVSTNAASMSATMPLGVLSASSSASGRPSAWARAMFGAAGQKATRRRPTVALKVRDFVRERGKNDRQARRKKQFHIIGITKRKKKLDLEKKTRSSSKHN